MTSENGYTFWSSLVRTKQRRSRLTALTLIWFLQDVKKPTPLFEKSRGRRPRRCGQPSHITVFTHHSHHGLGGYIKLVNGLRAAVSGALYADVRAYCSHVNIYYKDGTSVVLSYMTPSFLPKLAMLRSYVVKLVRAKKTN